VTQSLEGRPKASEVQGGDETGNAPLRALLAIGRRVEVGRRKYTIVTFLGSGGSGQLFEVESEDGGRYALKLYLPPYHLWQFGNTPMSEQTWARLSEAVKFQTKEYQVLSKMNHPHIVRVYHTGELNLQKAEQARLAAAGLSLTVIPALITELVDGLPLHEAIDQYPLDAADLSRVLAETAQALDYVHFKRQYMHADVKAANIMVSREAHTAVLVDFAVSKNFNFAEVGRHDYTYLLVNPSDLPDVSSLRAILWKASGASASREELYNLCFPTLDLYQFGLMLQQIEPSLTGILHPRELAYVHELTAELVDWEAAARRKSEPLESRVRRLAPQHFYPFGVRELVHTSAADRTIMLPGGDSVPLIGHVAAILENRSFRRLATINQLSLLNVVYPGADYKRSVHALQTLATARRLVMQLVATPMFRALFDEKAITDLLVVALLHDINHFPFLHIAQETRIDGLSNADVVDLFCLGETTGENGAQEKSIYALLDDIGMTRDRFIRLAYGKPHEQVGEIDQIIHSVISSGADIDKIAYLTLDSLFTGVKYGSGIDVNALLAGATVARTPEGDRLHLAYDETALQAVENVFMTRFWNFRSIYWHHTNRALMAMILHLMRTVYEEKGRDINEYLVQTKYLGENGAMAWLDAKYKSETGRPSILNGWLENRRILYRRLYTVRPAGQAGAPDDELFSDVARLMATHSEELELRRAVAASLETKFNAHVGVDDVLIDVPRRDGLNHPGEAYVVVGKNVKRLEELSEPIRHLKTNYQRLTERVRFFVSPAVAGAVGDRSGDAARDEIRRLLISCVAERRASSAPKGVT
jgi:HD superfamily phosphohydrolase/serine/threonine protein kinase